MLQGTLACLAVLTLFALLALLAAIGGGRRAAKGRTAVALVSRMCTLWGLPAQQSQRCPAAPQDRGWRSCSAAPAWCC